MKPINLWLLFNALVAILGSILVLSTSWNMVLSLIWLFHIILFTLLFRNYWITHIAQAWPNAVTFLRLTLMLLIVARFENIDRYLFCMLAWIAALLDILDGYLARKLNGQTLFGAVFDEEADAYYILFLSLLAFQNGILPWWILLSGIPRYVVLILRLYHQSNQLPPAKVPGARWIAGTAFTLFPLLFVMPGFLNISIGILITSGLLYSFLFESYLYVKNLSYLHYIRK